MHFIQLELGPWSEWGECSLTCNGGNRQRTRECGLPELDTDGNSLKRGKYDNPCKQPLSEIETCNDKKCPVFTEWSIWSSCSETCGGGFRKKSRKCVEATEERRARVLFDDNPCMGPLEVIEECNQQSCPEWTEWSDWTECSKTCGGGQKRKYRCV